MGTDDEEERAVVNPFWSEKAKVEAALIRSRPSELPPIQMMKAMPVTKAKPSKTCGAMLNLQVTR